MPGDRPQHPTGWGPLVRGTCPACGLDSLFLGAGGWVTCANLSCPDPGAAIDLLRPSATWPPVMKSKDSHHDEGVEMATEDTPTLEKAPWLERAREEFSLLENRGELALLRRVCDEQGEDSRGRSARWRKVATFQDQSEADSVLRRLSGE